MDNGKTRFDICKTSANSKTALRDRLDPTGLSSSIHIRACIVERKNESKTVEK